jgi:hypothetical protein
MIFDAVINIEKLTLEINDSAITATLKKIISSGSNCDVTFDEELSMSDAATLEHLISKHIPMIAKEIDSSVSARQIRTAMVMSGISIAQIEGAIDGLPEPTRTVAKIAWDYSNLYYRDNELVVTLAPVMGLTISELDDLWVLAKTL